VWLSNNRHESPVLHHICRFVWG